MDSIIEQGLTAVAPDVFVEFFFISFGVAHLAQDMAVGAQDTFDVVVGPVGVVQIAEGHLAAGEQIGRKRLIHNKFTFAMTESDAVYLPFLHPGKPGRTDGGNLCAGDERNMAVDVIAGQRG